MLRRYFKVLFKKCYKIDLIHRLAVIKFRMIYRCFTSSCSKSNIRSTKQKYFKWTVSFSIITVWYSKLSDLIMIRDLKIIEISKDVVNLKDKNSKILIPWQQNQASSGDRNYQWRNQVYYFKKRRRGEVAPFYKPKVWF